jgi:hypothetical protein
MKPKNMPPYPSKRQQVQDLLNRKNTLLSEMMFIEQSMLNRDFANFSRFIQLKQDVKQINHTIENSEVFTGLMKGLRKL